MAVNSIQSEKIDVFLKSALERYVVDKEVFVFTDVYLQLNIHSGELNVLDDDDEILSNVVVEDWKGLEGRGSLAAIETFLREKLENMKKAGSLESLCLMKPYSFVWVDGEKETISELLLVDEQETFLIHDNLLSGLDEELDAFLKDLLEN